MLLLNPFPDDKILTCLIQRICRQQRWFKMVQFVFDKVKNIVEKRKKAGYQHFFPFPTMFQKASHPGPIKSGIVW